MTRSREVMDSFFGIIISFRSGPKGASEHSLGSLPGAPVSDPARIGTTVRAGSETGAPHAGDGPGIPGQGPTLRGAIVEQTCRLGKPEIRNPKSEGAS